MRSEVESSTQLALQLIQAASTSSIFDAGDQKLNFLRKLAELETIRHLHIELRTPTDVLIPTDEDSLFEKSEAPWWFVSLVRPPAT